MTQWNGHSQIYLTLIYIYIQTFICPYLHMYKCMWTFLTNTNTCSIYTQIIFKSIQIYMQACSKYLIFHACLTVVQWVSNSNPRAHYTRKDDILGKRVCGYGYILSWIISSHPNSIFRLFGHIFCSSYRSSRALYTCFSTCIKCLIDVKNEIRASSSSFKHVMLQYFGFIPNLLRA